MIKTTGTNKTVAEGVLNYTWTVSKDVSKIEFRGVDANGNEGSPYVVFRGWIR